MSREDGFSHKRPMTDKEYAWMQRLEAAVDKVWNDLTDWEKSFIENRLEAFRRFGRKTFFSPRQWEIIDKISEKIL